MALEQARYWRSRSKRANAPIRYGFVHQDYGPGPVPPLAVLLRGGRGGEVRLKLYLSLLWVAAKHPHRVPDVPARYWAELLDLPDPQTNGARRILDAVSWLERNRFLATERSRGHATTLRLLNENGSGEDYYVPGRRMPTESAEGDPLAIPPESGASTSQHPRSPDRYFSLPSGFWTGGWAATLPGAAVAMLLIALVEKRARPTKRFWVSPAQARDRYALSEDTWSAGMRVLIDCRLVELHRAAVSPKVGWHRVRNTYWLNDEVLREAP